VAAAWTPHLYRDAFLGFQFLEQAAIIRASRDACDPCNNSRPTGMTCAHAHITRSEPGGYYSRLFGKPAGPIPRSQEAKLVELGSSMRYEMEREGTLTPRMGFTYFGQFLGHDLTHEEISFSPQTGK
jgi:hypothetical protein